MGIKLDDDSVSYDRSIWNAEIQKSFNSRFDVDNDEDLTKLNCQLAATEGILLDLPNSVIQSAFDAIQQKEKLDSYGCCITGLLAIHHAYPYEFKCVLSRSLASAEAMRGLSISGRVFGKKSTVPKRDQTRAILPLSALLSMCDSLLNVLLTPIADQLTPADPRIYFGARPKTQPLQLMHTCQLVIEKGMDRRSMGSISQGDIEKFYDRIRYTIIAEYLCHNGADIALVGAVLRFHACTSVILCLGDDSLQISNRTRGVLTGARSSVTLGRLPVQDCFSRCLPKWEHTGFDVGDHSICAGAWVDNIFGFGSCGSQSTSIIDQFEDELQLNWDLRLSPDSKVFVECKGHPHEDDEIAGWARTKHFEALGHIVSHDGCTETCWKSTLNSLWASFYANSAAVLDAKNLTAKLRLLNRVTRPKLDYVCSRWPYTRKLAEAINHTQMRMTALCIGLRRNAGESRDGFFRKRAEQARRVMKQEGLWSHRYCNALLNWEDHLRRERNRADWPSPLFHCQDSFWLQAQRLPWVCAARSIFGGGTGTRTLAIAPKARWEESTDKALAFLQL